MQKTSNNNKNEKGSVVVSQKLGNPAVVGLAGFGATTLLLQAHNLGWAGSGVVIWCALAFGGLAQLIAGFNEFKTGNNFGFAAFTTYGAFWLALAAILANPSKMVISSSDVGWFLVIFTLITVIFFIGSLKQNGALAFVFLTLLIGFIGLDISHLGGPAVFTKIAAWVLIVCGFSAWYLMAHVIYADLGIKLPVGKAWMK
jgi:succinate-acetate transporter protein